MGIQLTNEQVHCLYEIENWWNKLYKQTYEISGSPGTGKTSIVRYFIEYIGLNIRDVAFVCYMGKAAMQLARNGLPARTIHSLIYTYEKVLDIGEDGKIKTYENGKPKYTFRFTLKDSLPDRIKLIVVDEASMVNKDIVEDILSFDLPVIALGDLNQLPPVFGNPVFLKNPDYRLTQIMRQAEGDPIIWLSQRILHNEKLQIGVYGKSSVIPRSNINEFVLKKADVVLTATNKLRHQINKLFREDILNIKKLDMVNEGEKIVCVKNDWQRCINNEIYLMNGIYGTVDYVDIESFNGKKILIDFKPDFLNKKFKNVPLDYKRIMADPTKEYEADPFNWTKDQFEFAYAMTTHKMQGSQAKNVVFLNEPTSFDKDTYRRLVYTAITRAQESITIYL